MKQFAGDLSYIVIHNPSPANCSCIPEQRLHPRPLFCFIGACTLADCKTSIRFPTRTELFSVTLPHRRKTIQIHYTIHIERNTTSRSS